MTHLHPAPANVRAPLAPDVLISALAARQHGVVSTAQLRSCGLWRAPRAVLEVDSFFTHGDPSAFERDRRKQNDLEERGYRVRRVTDVQVDDRPADIARTVARLLGG